MRAPVIPVNPHDEIAGPAESAVIGEVRGGIGVEAEVDVTGQTWQAWMVARARD